jgi:hypothetical protein
MGTEICHKNPLYRLDVRPASAKTAVGGPCKLYAPE